MTRRRTTKVDPKLHRTKPKTTPSAAAISCSARRRWWHVAAMKAPAVAQAQKAAPATAATAPSGRKPNILVIWGDDIGIANISAYSNGLMGYETPNIDRIGQRGHQVPALLRRAVVHRRPRGVPDRPARHPHRPDQGRLPRRADGHEPARSLDRRPAQEPRLRHRPVRQEPRRRPQRVAADRERLRRVLRQPLPSQRRGRAGTAGLSEGPGLPRQVRPARRAASARRPTATIRRSIRASARSASRPSRTPARSPRSAWRRSTTRPRPRPSTS